MGGARSDLRRLRRRVRVLTLVSTLVCTLLPSTIALSQISGDAEWPTYGNDPGGMRYSPLSQINRENVSNLKVAWIFHTGDLSDGTRDRRRSGFEATPILVDGTLYFTTPFNRVIALDPETGKQRWAYDPKIDLTLDSFPSTRKPASPASISATTARSVCETCRVIAPGGIT
jgi:glucose dehydrogenase